MAGRARHTANLRGMSQNDEQPASLEPRWPIALTVLCFIALTIALRVLQPKRESVGPAWLVPALEIAMLLALLAANPAHIQERRRWLRRVAIGLIFALGAAALWSTMVLINGLISGSQVTQSASSLLASGALIWLGNALVFSLTYWIFDTGGPWVRYQGTRPYPDFAFTQQMSPELAPPGWRPMYVDYMVLGLNTSAAFSPTDVMPMARWAKLAMSAQSLLSLTVVALVVARAVNAFT